MGKPDAPQAPPPPTIAETTAATVESAKVVARLQKAMEFGDEMMKDGYVHQKTEVPVGATPVYDTQEIKTTAPSYLGDKYTSRYGGGVKKMMLVGKDGIVSLNPDWTGSQWGGGGTRDRYEKDYAGLHWSEAIEKSPNWGQGGSRSIVDEVKTLTGYEDTDGRVTKANLYFKINEDGSRSEVGRDEAIDVDFTGMGETDLARKRMEFEQETSPQQTQFLLDQMKKFGLGEGLVDAEGKPTAGFIEAAKKAVEISDPTGFAAREQLAGLARDYAPADVPEAQALEQFGEVAAAERLAAPPSLDEVKYTPQYERAAEMEAMRRVGEAPQFAELETTGPSLERAGPMDELQKLGVFGGMERAGELGGLERAGAMDALARSEDARTLERLEDIPEQVIDPESLAGRRFLEKQLIGAAQSGRTSERMGEEARRIARGRQAARHNIFGGGAVIEEARAVRQAEEEGQRRAISDLLGFLSSGQTAGDYESRLAQQNLANRLMGIQQRTGVEQAEFGMGQQALSQRNVAALQERADELGAIGQRNQVQEREYQAALQALQQRNLAGTTEYGLGAQRIEQQNVSALQQRADELAAIGQRSEAQQQEFQNLQSSLAQINQAREAQFAADTQAAGFDNTVIMQERADELRAMSQRNEAEEAEFRSLLQGLEQQQQARTGGFGMQAQATAQRNQAQEADFNREQAAMAQRNQAKQQAFSNAMQRTATQQQMQQQQMANLQSFSGLAPVSSQFAGLSGAQMQGQANFNPMQYQQPNAMGLFQSQQANQADIFGNQGRIFDTQMSNQADNAFGSILGGVAGSFGGGWGAAAGKALGKNWP